MRIVHLIVAASVLSGCSSYATIMGYPSAQEVGRAQSAMEQLAPGDSESLILRLFERLDSSEWGKYGILDVSEYRAEDYVSRTYWIGYYYNSGGGYGADESRVLAITTVNGKIESTYEP